MRCCDRARAVQVERIGTGAREGFDLVTDRLATFDRALSSAHSHGGRGGGGGGDGDDDHGAPGGGGGGQDGGDGGGVPKDTRDMRDVMARLEALHDARDAGVPMTTSPRVGSGARRLRRAEWW